MTSNESIKATYEWYKKEGMDTEPLKKRFSQEYIRSIMGRKGGRKAKRKEPRERVVRHPIGIHHTDPLNGLQGKKLEKVKELLKDDGNNWSF